MYSIDSMDKKIAIWAIVSMTMVAIGYILSLV
jgi:hypothetical protein